MKLTRRLEIVRQVYLQDTRPWVVAFSGGKDSTAVLQLVWLALSELPSTKRRKKIMVAYVDTGMDHFAFSDQVRDVLEKIAAAAPQQQMPVTVSVLVPELRHRYFVSVIGRGYAPPTHWFRWCTKGMRIRPMTQFIKKNISAHSEVVILLGLRFEESRARSEILRKYATKRKFVSRYNGLSNAMAFTPIEDLRKEEVWQFLMQMECPWGNTNRELASLYSLANNGECAPHSPGDGVGKTCGGSRFGCWTCTVVRKDKAGASLAENDDRYEALLEFRDWLATIRYERQRRWKIRRNGAPGPGPLRLSTRREILERLLCLEKEVKLTLIRQEELMEIQRLWNLDGDKKNTALAMCFRCGLRCG